ncbi:MAG: sensor histidine kinase [Alkalilacustris sp.]
MRRSFAGQWAIGVACLALLSISLGALGVGLLHEAQQRLDRSRIAGAIHATLAEVAHDKTHLRVWAYRALAGAGTPAHPLATAEERTRLLAQMTEGLERIVALDHAARRLARSDVRAPGPDTRAMTVAALRRALDGLAQETGALLGPGPTAAVRAGGFDALDRDLDAAEGAGLAALMEAALVAEAAALADERARADRAVGLARGLALGSAALALPVAVGLALWLTAGLRGPLARLEAGIAAFATNRPGQRLGRFRHREFDRLARQFDAMADEIDRHRAREAGARAALEAEVAHRTAELSQALAALAASDRARTQLLADVGHGLRTPVTVIRGEAQVALRRPQDHQGLQAGLGRIVDVTRQMERLIEDVLVLTHDPAGPVAGPSADQLAVQPEPVSLDAAVAPALGLARRHAQARGVHLTADIPPGLQLLADRARFDQVLGCLLDNAVRYCRAGDTVTLRALCSPEAGVAIEVADTGIGIDPADVPHLATRGWRSAAARAHRPDGLGLGLAIAQRLAAAHGARLRVGPAGGGGTLARLDWPAAPSRPSSPPPAPDTAQGPDPWTSC